ncbi:MAG TPA: efflux RND transporter periplasmic adaptor subunit [Polyangiaceae bacterium]|nr:efflux RND transporter periplasmic adaptor subunit [Polyangiaceae bacterium]
MACSKGAGPAAVRVRPLPLVVVGKIGARDVPVEVRSPVDLRPLAQADVGSKTLGVLDAVLVDRGDHVRRGQLLALVRPSDLPDQLAAARGSLAQSQASLSLAEANYERARSLAPNGLVSQQELQSASAALATSQAAQAAAQAQVSAIAIRLGETRIDSPLDGVVAARRLDPGAMVGLLSGATIVTVARIDVLRVLISVTEKDIPNVHVGQDAHVELDALPGRSFGGKVVRIAPEIDPSTRTLDAEVRLPNPGEELRAGMFGHGSIVVDVHAKRPIVMASSVQMSNGRSYVYVLAGDRVQRREIQTGVDGGAWLEVLQGLVEGEEVVTAGADVLSDGVSVRVARDVDPFTGADLATAGQGGKAD